MLKEYGTTGTIHLKETWKSELNVDITDDQWDDAWKCEDPQHLSPYIPFPIAMCLMCGCLKCTTETDSLMHCLWSCWRIQRFWHIVRQEINKI